MGEFVLSPGDQDTLLLRILQCLDERRHTTDTFEAAEIANWLRQIPIDESPLVHLVNRRYQLPILFKVEEPLQPNAGIVSQHAGDTMAGGGFKPMIELKLPGFLNYPVLFFHEERLTVVGAVRAVANRLGGRHVDVLDEETTRIVAHADLFRPAGMSPVFFVMRPIARATVLALEPLRVAIQERQAGESQRA